MADLINSSKKVALFCGIGCENAHDEVVALAEKVKAPVGHTYRGKPFIEYDNPYDMGMTGMIGFGMATRRSTNATCCCSWARIFRTTNSCRQRPRSRKWTSGLSVWDAEANSILEFGATCARRYRRCCRCWMESRTENI